MPEGLEIDKEKPLNGTMAPYAEQVLICTGKSDWKSRIEDENGGDNLAADLKELMGRGGIYSDVCVHFLFLLQVLDILLFYVSMGVQMLTCAVSAAIP